MDTRYILSRTRLIGILAAALGLIACGASQNSPVAATPDPGPAGNPNTFSVEVLRSPADPVPVEGMLVSTYLGDKVTIDQTVATDAAGNASFSVSGNTVTFSIVDGNLGSGQQRNEIVRGFVDAPVRNYVYYVDGHRTGQKPCSNKGLRINAASVPADPNGFAFSALVGDQAATSLHYSAGNPDIPFVALYFCTALLSDPSAVEILLIKLGTVPQYKLITVDLTPPAVNEVNVDFTVGMTNEASRYFNATNQRPNRVGIFGIHGNGLVYPVGAAMAPFDTYFSSSGQVPFLASVPGVYEYVATGLRQGPWTSVGSNDSRISQRFVNLKYASVPVTIPLDIRSVEVTGVTYNATTRRFDFTVSGNGSEDFVSLQMDYPLAWRITAPPGTRSIRLMDLPSPADTWATADQYVLDDPFTSNIMDLSYATAITDMDSAASYAEAVPLLMQSENPLDHGIRDNTEEYRVYVSYPR